MGIQGFIELHTFSSCSSIIHVAKSAFDDTDFHYYFSVFWGFGRIDAA
jgi:hypothetical protein